MRWMKRSAVRKTVIVDFGPRKGWPFKGQIWPWELEVVWTNGQSKDFLTDTLRSLKYYHLLFTFISVKQAFVYPMSVRVVLCCGSLP